MTGWEFTVWGDPCELSPNARLHWAARSRLVKAWRVRTRLLALSAGIDLAGLPKAATIGFRCRRAHLVDDDNLAGSLALKAIRDSLFPKDRQVRTGTLTQEIDRCFLHRPEVVVTITPSE